MDRLNDQEIGCMWARHYPIRNDNDFSWNILPQRCVYR